MKILSIDLARYASEPTTVILRDTETTGQDVINPGFEYIVNEIGLSANDVVGLVRRLKPNTDIDIVVLEAVGVGAALADMLEAAGIKTLRTWQVPRAVGLSYFAEVFLSKKA